MKKKSDRYVRPKSGLVKNNNVRTNRAINQQWMCDWQEQLNSIRDIPENSLLIKADTADLFCFAENLAG